MLHKKRFERKNRKVYKVHLENILHWILIVSISYAVFIQQVLIVAFKVMIDDI